MTQNVNIQWHTVKEFQAVKGFMMRKVPEEYHMTESEAFHMLLTQPLPHELAESLTLDPDVQVWGLLPNGHNPAALWVGLPQFDATGHT